MRTPPTPPDPTPPDPTPPPRAAGAARYPGPPWAAALLFLAFCLALIALGAYIVHRFDERIKQATLAQLDTIADLKVSQAQGWLEERHGDLRVLMRAIPLVYPRVLPGETARPRGEDPHTYLEGVQGAYSYLGIGVYDGAGHRVDAVGAAQGLPEGRLVMALLAGVGRARGPSLHDFHRHAGDGIGLGFAAAFPWAADPAGVGRGYVYAHVDPHRRLYPMLRHWPVPTESGEALLVRRVGERVQTLSVPPPPGGEVPFLERPLNSPGDTPRLAAALAVQGQRGPVAEAVNFAGVPVVATLRGIAGTPWSLVVQVDRAEAEKPQREVVRMAAILLAILLLLAGLSFTLWWRGATARRAREEQRVATEREGLVRRLDYLSRYANDILLLVDPEGHILDANERAAQAYGLPVAALRGTALMERVAEPAREVASAHWRGLLAGGEALFESRHRRADGGDFPVEVSARLISQDGQRCIQAIVRDITERKRAEAEIRLAARVLDASGEAIAITGPDQRILMINRAFTQITGYTAAEVIGKTPRVLSSGRHHQEFYARMWGDIQGLGHWQGEIWNRRKTGEVYPEWLGVTAVRDEAGELTHYIGIFSDITDQKANQERIEYLANHDPLTGLPNRNLFRERLRETLANARRTNTKVAFVFVDLDHFKHINDSLGHLLGDQLLCLVAERLVRDVRETDTVSRQGGDEFVVLLTHLASGEQARAAVEKMLASFAEPMEVEGHLLRITMSLGIAIYPDDATDPEDLLRFADAAVYAAKEAGRATFRFFSRELEQLTQYTYEMENHLRNALAQGEFYLHYQPQVESATGRIVAVEALLRWHNPLLGEIPPDTFIPIAEQSGLIVPIGRWVLREACRQAAAWWAAGLPPVVMSVNCSVVQIKSGDLLPAVLEALSASGLPPERLEIELAEASLMQHSEAMLGVVGRLREIGVALSVDHFGIGYSNLSYLKRFAVSKLKIDRAFILSLTESQESGAIVRAILQMAQGIHLTTVAGGVESQTQLRVLKEEGCDEIQGLLFSGPVGAEDCARLLGQIGGLPD